MLNHARKSVNENHTALQADRLNPNVSVAS
jgi:hypothetical protein